MATGVLLMPSSLGAAGVENQSDPAAIDFSSERSGGDVFGSILCGASCRLSWCWKNGQSSNLADAFELPRSVVTSKIRSG
jgi:hypothetical protein